MDEPQFRYNFSILERLIDLINAQNRDTKQGYADFMSEQFEKALETLKRKEGYPWSRRSLEVAAEQEGFNISTQTIRRFVRGEGVSVSVLIGIARTLDLPMQYFTPDPATVIAANLADPYNTVPNARLVRELLAIASHLTEDQILDLVGTAKDLKEYSRFQDKEVSLSDEVLAEFPETKTPEQDWVLNRLLHPSYILETVALRSLLTAAFDLSSPYDLHVLIRGARHHSPNISSATDPQTRAHYLN